jgi:hypothetical protein
MNFEEIGTASLEDFYAWSHKIIQVGRRSGDNTKSALAVAVMPLQAMDKGLAEAIRIC